MALPRFFRTPKPQKFGYVPRFYNPEKEELEKRVRRAESREPGDSESMKMRISSGFKARGKGGKRPRSKAVLRSNLILVAIVVLLVLFSYVILVEYTPALIQFVE